jgi:hypothetical protein
VQLLRVKRLDRCSGNICNLHYQQDGGIIAVATDATDAKIQLHKSNAEVEGWMCGLERT